MESSPSLDSNQTSRLRRQSLTLQRADECRTNSTSQRLKYMCVFLMILAWKGKRFGYVFQHLHSFYERGVYGYTLVGQDI
jgi:hypothetical protein